MLIFINNSISYKAIFVFKSVIFNYKKIWIKLLVYDKAFKIKTIINKILRTFHSLYATYYLKKIVLQQNKSIKPTSTIFS